MFKRMIAAIAALQMMSVAAWASTDCYVGVGAGKNISALTTDTTGPVSVALDGFQIGARGGCDVAVGVMVLGGWVGYDWADVENSVDFDYASIGAKLGYKINDGALAYAVGGFAAPDLKFGSDERGTLYGAGLELDFSNIQPGLVAWVEWNGIDWRQSGDMDASTDTIMVGAKIKLQVLK